LGIGDDATSYPALLDVTKGTATPITANVFMQQRGRNRFIAFRSGPFATVARAGDCLNVRESASTSAKSLGCFADGVLLRDLGQATSAGGTPWRQLATPAGAQGWASSEYLDR